MNIVVMCGGLSMERNVSITSGTLICKALRKLGHKAVLVDMFFGLEDIETPLEELFDNLPPLEDARVAEEAPDLDAVRASRKWKSPSKVGKGVFELCALADVVFLGLHGACGEDGRIQAALDLLGVPYTGSGYLGSALAMDKDLTKQLARAAGVRTPQWRVLRYTPEQVEALCGEMPLPCVVKPVDSGSSIGVSIAYSRRELAEALRQNQALGRVIVEQYVQGREIDVGVLEGRSLPSIEIIPKQGFYDYKNKYQAGATVEICPTPIEPEIERELGATALKVHKLLGLNTYSRSDFIVDGAGDVYFLEINTLPGMTPTSLMPQEAAAAGIDYETLCSRIIEAAVGGGSDR
ncbi:MAG: D-alanine--D-alanine ligase [Clostridia bacterium]|nr:D-alanine--D-alanine ligase [Clostridia bacterium]